MIRALRGTPARHLGSRLILQPRLRPRPRTGPEQWRQRTPSGNLAPVGELEATIDPPALELPGNNSHLRAAILLSAAPRRPGSWEEDALTMDFQDCQGSARIRDGRSRAGAPAVRYEAQDMVSSAGVLS